MVENQESGPSGRDPQAFGNLPTTTKTVLSKLSMSNGQQGRGEGWRGLSVITIMAQSALLTQLNKAAAQKRGGNSSARE